jgi:hypothetical protein
MTLGTAAVHLMKQQYWDCHSAMKQQHAAVLQHSQEGTSVDAWISNFTSRGVDFNRWAFNGSMAQQRHMQMRRLKETLIKSLFLYISSAPHPIHRNNFW